MGARGGSATALYLVPTIHMGIQRVMKGYLFFVVSVGVYLSLYFWVNMYFLITVSTKNRESTLLLIARMVKKFL